MERSEAPLQFNDPWACLRASWGLLGGLWGPLGGLGDASGRLMGRAWEHPWAVVPQRNPQEGATEPQEAPRWPPRGPKKDQETTKTRSESINPKNTKHQKS